MNFEELTIEDIKLINDDDKLIEILKNQNLDTRIRIQAVANLNDKSVFKDYAHYEDPFLRSQAARYIEDDEMLLDLILNDSNDHVRHSAGMNFINTCDIEKYEDILVEFAVENPEYNVNPFFSTDFAARLACRRIEDTSNLLEVIMKSSSNQVCYYAISKVDNDALYKLLKSDELDVEKALMVAEKLNDHEKLKELLQKCQLDYESQVRVAMKLKDDEKLREFLKVPLGPKVSEDKVFPNLFPGDEIYKSIVFSYPNEDIAIAALNNIGYKRNLKDIIKHHDNPRICDLAKDRLMNLWE